MRKKYRIIKVNRYKDYETGCLEDYSVYDLTLKVQVILLLVLAVFLE